MLDFYAHLWPWLAACLAAGAATDALVPSRAGKRPARWLIWAGLAFFAGAAAISLGAVEGAVSIHIESALACFAAFIAGAGGAALIFRRTLAGNEAWAIGLVPAMLLWWGAAHVAQPAYQADLQKRVAALAQAAGADPAGLSLAGRDVTAIPAISANKDLMGQIAIAPGVRRVVALEGPPPAESEKKEDLTATIPGPATAVSTDAAPPPSGELDAAQCQRALDAVVASEPVAFSEARATINRRAALALDKAVEVIRRCPDATIEVRGHGDAGAWADTLSRRRALAAEHYLRREGVAGRKIVAVGEKAAQEHRSGIDFIVR
jgi:outer membrane protein OmpA-like peptidoglycan-associated protein